MLRRHFPYNPARGDPGQVTSRQISHSAHGSKYSSSLSSGILSPLLVFVNTPNLAERVDREHYVCTVHGLLGTPEDLSYLKEALERSGGTGTLVHLARCNKNKTLDGVAEGGTRLAEEASCCEEALVGGSELLRFRSTGIFDVVIFRESCFSPSLRFSP